MMRYLFRLCSALSVLLTVLPAHAGSNTLEMTVSTTITPSTCQATLHDNSGKANGIVDVGDVYISQIVNKTNSQAFSLVFSDCVGLAKKQATVTLTAKTGCDGASGGGNGFRNALNGSDDAANVSAEVWTTSTPASSGSKQLSCASPAQQLVDLAQASDETTVVMPLSTRIVLSSGSTVADLHTGSFSTQGLFTITYE
ncbi:fimbrial protein [Salmonella enterica subsp. enterica serovar Ajiobo]|uniref:Fimbrial protein n=1 Tax=Salmonella enterica I TaxID=59201 RepID=A0A625QYR1_SALET|nr:fimbrial protein [Salmonella enterica subsp. enterica serovar Ajiobo]EKF5618568.1 fimbrial protein [Salmonella enterica subsp. enterica]EBZ0862448.1 fimbrial protein [Salmonella enterica subsp. enterica serovar Ajiobo]EDA0143758.1 fimbrial protein [Salmonella enterica subsp. enterica serovar Ajiobo]EGE9213537.1 fimbrial protein [Salmonella enterica subsp. enterica serovar Ajiobo]